MLKLSEALRACAAVLATLPIRAGDLPQSANIVSSVLNTLRESVPRAEELERLAKQAEAQAKESEV
ncbi:MAG: hypothetical protein J5556_03480 [Deltaproteobacteria bacterium]|nr:hypothetical protein [Deltaproteobacteria bacterium]